MALFAVIDIVGSIPIIVDLKIQIYCLDKTKGLPEPES